MINDDDGDSGDDDDEEGHEIIKYGRELWKQQVSGTLGWYLFVKLLILRSRINHSNTVLSGAGWKDLSY